MLQELSNGQPDVGGDLPEEDRRDVSAGVKRNCGRSSVRMAVLFVRTLLPRLRKAESLQDRCYFARFKDGNVPHGSGSDGHGVSTDKFSFEFRLTVLKKQLNDLPKVTIKLIERLCLGMSTRKTGYVANVESGVRAAFDNSCESAHVDRFRRMVKVP